MIEMKTLTIGGNTYEIVDETARNSIPTKTSDLVNNSGFITAEDIPEGGNVDLTNYYTKTEIDNKGFITAEDLLGDEGVNLSNYYTKNESDAKYATKADIPTDESYELLGTTPLTLDKTSNIKLVADGETTYSIETPTVWNFDDVEYTSSNASLSTDKGYYEIVSTEGCTAWYNSYIAFVISGLEIGKSYHLICDFNGLTNDETNRVHSGSVAVFAGTDTKGTLLVSGHEFKFSRSFEFTATEENVYIRYYPVKDKAPFVGWVGHFNKLYLNYADTTEELTEIYSKSGAFTDVVTFKAIPNGATITTEPTASVYIKAPTDKTLTESDVPADAEETGKRIEAVKNLLPLYGKTIVNFGDSIFGNQQPPNDISTFLAEKTGATVYNCGFGGCRMSVHPTSEYNAFSMYSLANSIASGDYTTQETALESTEVTLPARFTPSVERLKGIDFSKVDIITIAYGTNDYNGYGVNLDNDENALDINTFGGALRYSIEKLLTAYPNLKIFVLSIAYRFYVDENNEYIYDTNNHANNYGKYAMDYNAKLKEVAEEYNLPYVDDYNIGIGKFNRYQYFNANDGAHHKETGRRLIAEHLAKQL